MSPGIPRNMSPDPERLKEPPEPWEGRENQRKKQNKTQGSLSDGGQEINPRLSFQKCMQTTQRAAGPPSEQATYLRPLTSPSHLSLVFSPPHPAPRKVLLVIIWHREKWKQRPETVKVAS